MAPVRLSTAEVPLENLQELDVWRNSIFLNDRLAFPSGFALR